MRNVTSRLLDVPVLVLLAPPAPVAPDSLRSCCGLSPRASRCVHRAARCCSEERRNTCHEARPPTPLPQLFPATLSPVSFQSVGVSLTFPIFSCQQPEASWASTGGASARQR